MKEDIYKIRRLTMVSEQIEKRGIKDKRVIEAMQAIPRHLFVPESEIDNAYSDFPLPIGCNQTISQPYMVALMTSLLKLSGKERVLEIGTGSGYQAAILSKLAKEVYTIERIGELKEKAQTILKSLKIENVYVILGNGTLGLPEYAPYDRVIVTAAAGEIPKPLEDQLKDPGIMVIPVGKDYQRLIVATKENGLIEKRDEGGCVFVPLIGKYGLKND